MKSTFDAAAILREAGYRATPGKIGLLEMLAGQSKPLTVSEIQKKLRSNQDTVTLYRSLEALAQSGIVARSELGHGHAHYELLLGKKHHHHLVCTNCDRVEDFSDPSCEASIQHVAKKMPSTFSVISGHSIELFGLCVKCS